MKKMALFLEGDSEKIAIRFYLQKYLPQIEITLDVYEFIDHAQDSSIVLLYDCLGHESVLPKAKEYSSTLWNDTIVLVRDLERMPCFSSLSADILQEIPQLKNQGAKFGLIAAPCMEAVYGCDMQLFQAVMQQVYKETHGKSAPAIFAEECQFIDWKNPTPGLRAFCARYNLGYKKIKIASKFFSQLNYSSSDHPYIMRLKDLFVEL